MTDISQYCEEWSDDERMRVMFAPLRSKELNPESWNSKISFWTSLIQKWSEQSNKCSFTIRQLEKDFERDGISPHCLVQVEIFFTDSKYFSLSGPGHSRVQTVGTDNR